jgi:hypothetical protein
MGAPMATCRVIRAAKFYTIIAMEDYGLAT